MTIAVLIFTRGETFFRHSQVRSDINSTASACLDTLQKTLALGSASTVTIQNSAHVSAGTTPPPGSEIIFSTSTLPGAVKYDIYWSDQPPNSLHMATTWTTSGGPQTRDAILAGNVTSLSFTWDSSDAALIGISMTLLAKLDSGAGSGNDSSGKPLNSYELFLPNRTVRLLGQ